MKTLGIIGGIAPESTVEYYRAIVDLHRRRTGAYPSIIINSIDLTKMIGFVAAKQLDDLTRYLLGEIHKLVLAGADVALLASNTPHIVFDALARSAAIPLISIVDAAADAAAGLRRVALFGTRFTMESEFYATAFGKRGIEVVVPAAADRDVIHARYMDELVNGRFLPETRDALLAIVGRLKSEHAIDGVILGGTELPLLFRAGEWNGVRLLDTGRIHVEAAVERMVGS
jgi:aspartate racemase